MSLTALTGVRVISTARSRTSEYANVEDLIGDVIGGFRGLDFLYPGAALLSPAVGYYTLLYAPVGYVRLRDCLKGRAQALQIGDTEGAHLNTVQVARMGFLTAGATVMIPTRVLTLASILTDSQVALGSVSIIGQATYLLSNIAGGLFLGFYTCSLVGTAYSALKALAWRVQLSTAFLNEKLKPVGETAMRKAGTPEELKKIARAQAGQWLKRSLAHMRKEGYVREELREKLAALENSESSREEIGTKILLQNKQLLIHTLGCNENIDDDALLIEFGLAMKIEMAKAAQRADLCRVFGSDAVQQLQSDALDEAAKLELAKSALLATIAVDGTKSVLGLLGVVSVIFGFYGQALGMFGSVIYSLSNFCWIGLDGYSSLCWAKDSTAGKQDKLLIYISIVIVVLSIITACIATFMFGAPLLAFGIALALHLIWLSINLSSLYRIHQYEQAHPSVEALMQELEVSEMSDEQARVRFNLLPEKVREALKVDGNSSRDEIYAVLFAYVLQVQQDKKRYYNEVAESICKLTAAEIS